MFIARTVGNLTMGFARTVENLMVFFFKSQIPGGSPGGGMIAVGIDSYIIPEQIRRYPVECRLNTIFISLINISHILYFFWVFQIILSWVLYVSTSLITLCLASHCYFQWELVYIMPWCQNHLQPSNICWQVVKWWVYLWHCLCWLHLCLVLLYLEYLQRFIHLASNIVW